MIEDIEDIISNNDITPKERNLAKNYVKVRARKTQITKEGAPNEDVTGGDDYQSFVPGTQKIYVKTWGCTHNSSDSEYMAGQLSSYGFMLTDNKENADLWLLNSCTVKTPAEDHFRNEIQAARKSGKPVVLAGCVPQGSPHSQLTKGLSVIGVQQIDRVVEVVEETLKGNTVRLLKSKREKGKGRLGGASLDLPKVRRNPLVEIIPINTGCLNQCTYCKTKHARGELGSYPPDEIIARAEQCFKEGVRELWLTSEDTGAYGRDIGASLPDLLHSLADIIPDGCMMRVGMTNPPYILEHLKEMAVVLSHPRVYSFLHIPVQSGSDSVLADMKREYCRRDFENVVDFLQERVPGITIATDIICGFPTETEDEFEETMSLCEKYKFPSLFINQFFPRPGTPAARMPRVPPAEVKRRTKKLSEFFQSYQPYGHKVNEVQDILVTELSHDKLHYVGHNKFYEQVIVPKDPDLLGRMVTVKIESAQKHCLIGTPIRIKVQKNVLPPLPAFKQNGFISTNDDLKENSLNKCGVFESTFDSFKPLLMPCSLVVFVIAFIVRVLWIFWV